MPDVAWLCSWRNLTASSLLSGLGHLGKTLSFPDDVRDFMGYALYEAQMGTSLVQQSRYRVFVVQALSKLSRTIIPIHIVLSTP